MNIRIRWKDCHRSNAVESHVEAKVTQFENFSFVMPDAKVEIVYYPKNESFAVRMNIQVVKRGTIRSEASADDILTAINDATSKITDQLRRVKTQYGK